MADQGPNFSFFPAFDFKSFLSQIQRGAVPGYAYKQRHFFCLEASSTYFSTFWSANTPSSYNFLTTPQTLRISSTNSADTALGTGARTVLITGLNANYDVITEIITLNGQVGVTTANIYFRINDLECQTYGTDKRNRGDIYLGSGTITGSGSNTNPQGFILAGAVVSEVGVYTVPRGYALVSFDFELSVSAGKEASFRSQIRPNANAPFRARGGRNVFEKNTETFEITTAVIYETSDIELQVIANSGDTKVGADMQTALVDVKFL